MAFENFQTKYKVMFMCTYLSDPLGNPSLDHKSPPHKSFPFRSSESTAGSIEE